MKEEDCWEAQKGLFYPSDSFEDDPFGEMDDGDVLVHDGGWKAHAKGSVAVGRVVQEDALIEGDAVVDTVRHDDNGVLVNAWLLAEQALRVLSGAQRRPHAVST